MIKHWPGGGPGEAGRDAHFSFGKYAVYPGKNLAEQLIPFTEGALKLDGGTKMASAVMPYYTISYGVDTINKENVGNSYNKYLITDLLRGTYGFDGVVCTDWGVTKDETAVDGFGTTPWGAETLSVAERHYKIIMAGVDQFGGNNDMGPIVEAYQYGRKRTWRGFHAGTYGTVGRSVLKNIFRVGFLKIPTLMLRKQKALWEARNMKAGYDAQLKSIVLLKNKDNVLPLDKAKTVYIPKRNTPAQRSFFGETPAKYDYPVNIEIARKYFKITDNPAEADVALVVIESPATELVMIPWM